MPAIIVLGDRTDHGGEVIQASGFTDTHGKRMARVGDKVHCPKKGHGTTEIVTGDTTFVVDGKAVAYHGCKTSCGATLISSQAVSTVNFGGAAQGGASQAQNSPTTSQRSAQSAVASSFDEQAQLISIDGAEGVTGVAWFIETNDGRTMSGRVGLDGLLPRTHTLAEDEYSIYWGDEALAKSAGQPT